MKVPSVGLLVLVGSVALLWGCVGDNQQEDDREATRTALAQPTATPTDTPTGTPTDTPTQTPTNTNTRPPTDTPTITPTATETPTGERPTRTPLGERLFSIVPPAGGLGTTPDMTRTGLFSTGFNGNNVATTFAAQDFTLVGGSPDDNGVASLTLGEDFVFAVGNPISTVCFRVRAEGSTGTIDCDGGTAVDARITQDAGTGAPPPVLETGIGQDGGPGAAFLLVTQEAVQLTGTVTLDDCLNATYDPPTTTVYTTGTATAVKGAQTLAVPMGENFRCDTFRDTDSAGMLISPSVANNPPVGDVANILRLADSAEVPATPTATLPGAETPTPTPTEEAVPPIGERVFSIASPSGGLGTTPDATRTGLFSTGVGGNNVATVFAAQDFTLVAGPADVDGVAPLSLKADVVFAVGNPVSLVCFRIRAAGSSGTIDCDGGTAVDVRLTQDAGAEAPPSMIEGGIGADGGPGAALLMVTQESVQLPTTSTLDDCVAATYDAPFTTFYTTRTATAVKGAQTLALPTGENFDCATFTETDGPGMIVNPAVANQFPVGDVANVLRLADSATPP